MIEKMYETPTLEEIEIKVEDVMAGSLIGGDSEITDEEVFGG